MKALGIFKKGKRNKVKNQKKGSKEPGANVSFRATAFPVKTLKPTEVLRSPHLSEKATMLKDKNKVYVFVVSKSANKKIVGQEIEKLYKVKVRKIRIINLPPKPKRLGRTRGSRPGFKKALVYLEPSQSIDII
jgi:large subunit ribosomal protein L23